MTNNQDIPCRRVYVMRPNESLLEKISLLDDVELLKDINRPQVVMTEELPFEEYLEGWRLKILNICKVTFLKEILLEYPIMNEQTAVELLGSVEPTSELFDQWWEAEEAEYTEIKTNWKN